MSYCVNYGKDKVIFLSEEDLAKPSTVTLPEDEEAESGFLLPNGEINWNCPCLGSMVIGPCNVEFRESLSCFHKSTAEPRGSDCIDKFRDLNDCMARYPKLYARDEEDERKELDQIDFEKESENSEHGGGGEVTTDAHINSSVETTTTDSSAEK